MPETAGTLYIVATPIGNMEDLSPRAARVLRDVDVVLCEDTRHSGRLLAAIGVRARRVSLHEQNEDRRVAEVIAGLRAGRDYALVSDAGTPLISDPGYRLLEAARREGLTVSPIPGPCAAIAAVSVAGLPTDRFCFEGFLPTRAAARRARLDALATEPRTMVFYESGRRLQDSLRDCLAAFGGERPATLARELTKTFESLYRDTLAGLVERLGEDAGAVRGECVLVVAGAGTAQAEAQGHEQALRVLLEFLPPSQAARAIARLYGVPRRVAYDLATRMSAD